MVLPAMPTRSCGPRRCCPPNKWRWWPRALATLQATARHADGGANWFAGINPQRPADWLPPVQDCHGAPGIVCRLAAAPHTPEWDTLLLQAGALTWHAGPLSKGASLCHGTAGSGFAMLKLWRRSGDPV